MRPLALACVLAVLWTAAGHATELNAPVVESPTIGSEIDRGYSAAAQCGFTHEPTDYGTCIRRLADDQAARRSNVDAFKLGLYFAAWQSEDLYYRSALKLTDNPLAQEVAPQWFRSAQSTFSLLAYFQKRLGITEAQMLQAIKPAPQTLERLAFWNAGATFP